MIETKMIPCEICGAPSEETCSICGRAVCSRHYVPERAICVVCLETLCHLCNKQLSVGYCKVCGRLVCRDCSVEDGAAIICKDCAQKLSKKLP